MNQLIKLPPCPPTVSSFLKQTSWHHLDCSICLLTEDFKTDPLRKILCNHSKHVRILEKKVSDFVLSCSCFHLRSIKNTKGIQLGANAAKEASNSVFSSIKRHQFCHSILLQGHKDWSESAWIRWQLISFNLSNYRTAKRRWRIWELVVQYKAEQSRSRENGKNLYVE